MSLIPPGTVVATKNFSTPGVINGERVEWNFIHRGIFPAYPVRFQGFKHDVYVQETNLTILGVK